MYKSKQQIKQMKTSSMFTAKQISNLKNHKYSCRDDSIMSTKMQAYWNWLVTQIPITIAPNVLTLFGLAVNVSTALLLISYSPTAREDAPAWVFVISAFGLFVYQSLDAIDGKQARRTDSASPLGELFDHGCDAISTAFVSMELACTLAMGHDPTNLFFLTIMGASLFYLAHWQTYVTGTLVFGEFDVTESQTVAMLLMMISAVFGNQCWSYSIPFVDRPLRVIPCIIGYACGGYSIYNRFAAILEGGAGKNGSTVANSSILSPFLPMLIFSLPLYCIYDTDGMDSNGFNIYYQHPCLTALVMALVGSNVSGRLVISHMSKAQMVYDRILLVPLALFLYSYLGLTVYGLPTLYVIWALLLITIAYTIWFGTKVCSEIAEALGIWCLKLGSRSK